MGEQPITATVYIDTYGCQMNVLDSELVTIQLGALGYRMVDAPDAARVVLLNTCSVRDLSEHKVWSALGRLGLAKQRGRPDLVIAVLGCMAERDAATLQKRAPYVDVICGPSDLDRLPLLLDNALRNKGVQIAVAGHTSRRSHTLERGADGVDGIEALDLSRSFSAQVNASAQAYVRITRGCDKFCSFCVVPFTRGPETHRPPQHVVDEVRGLVDKGVREVTLLGQTVNHYQYREGGKTTSFADLLWRVHEEVPHLPRLRFVTSYPRDFGDDALDAMAAASRICRYLHLPAQSGSDRVLKAMNRGYTRDEYVGLLERARARMPDVRLAGDMIAGFPSESDDDHAASLQLLRQARYKSCFVFKYSPRPGTLAARRFVDDVPDDVKRTRNLELLALQSQISLDVHRELVGRTFEILVEGRSRLRALAHEGASAQPSPRRALGHGPLPRFSEESQAVATADNSREHLIGRTMGDEIVAFAGPAELVGRIVRVCGVAATPLAVQARLAAAPPRAQARRPGAERGAPLRIIF